MNGPASGSRGKVLVTGGAGFIGTHCCIALAVAGYEPVILDNLSNPLRNPVEAIHAICGKRPALIRADVRDRSALDAVFTRHDIGSVIHLAGQKAVRVSLTDPFGYYSANVGGTVNLVDAMERHGVRRLVFSSSAAVYGQPETVPVREDAPQRPANPYARTKSVVEAILADCHAARPDWSVVSLRYFNPVGAHESGLIGEEPRENVDNLMPWIVRAAAGDIDHLSIHGGDYPTRDGTCVRDYVHVMDIAEGHVAALALLEAGPVLDAINLGKGHGISVLEMVGAFSAAIGRDVPHVIAPRRPGDIAETWADISRARSRLGWAPGRSLEQMCADAWRWRCNAAAG